MDRLREMMEENDFLRDDTRSEMMRDRSPKEMGRSIDDFISSRDSRDPRMGKGRNSIDRGGDDFLSRRNRGINIREDILGFERRGNPDNPSVDFGKDNPFSKNQINNEEQPERENYYDSEFKRSFSNIKNKPKQNEEYFGPIVQPNLNQNCSPQQNEQPQQEQRQIGINDILVAPLTALYAFTLKIHEGFLLTEEIKVIATLQLIYLMLGLIMNSYVFVVLSIGNILSILIVLSLASSYINLPDFLTPGGLYKKITKQDNQQPQNPQPQYNQNFQNSYYQQNSGMQYNGSHYQNPAPQFNGNIGQNPMPQFGGNINPNLQHQYKTPPNMNMPNNINLVNPNFENNGYVRNENANNLAEGLYNKQLNSENPFNNAGLNTNIFQDNNIKFGVHNTSGVMSNVNLTPPIYTNDISSVTGDENSKGIDFNAINEDTFKPTQVSPNIRREELFENSPYKNQVIENEKDKERVFNSLIPQSEPEKRPNLINKVGKNLLNILKDGFESSAINEDDYELL